MSFGEKLTILRKARGMSQEDLANSLNVSRKAILDEVLFNVEEKIYVSKANYEKLKQNLNRCMYKSYNMYYYE